MGCGPLSGRKPSGSSFDNDKKDKSAPNPDPKNCEITEMYLNDKFIILKINYKDCTNFEGNKILVYENVSFFDLKQQLKTVGLDPHFSDNKKYHSPIARFEPTKKGLEYAVKFCKGN